MEALAFTQFLSIKAKRKEKKTHSLSLAKLYPKISQELSFIIQGLSEEGLAYG